jgi:hypothetical protein
VHAYRTGDSLLPPGVRSQSAAFMPAPHPWTLVSSGGTARPSPLARIVQRLAQATAELQHRLRDEQIHRQLILRCVIAGRAAALQSFVQQSAAGGAGPSMLSPTTDLRAGPAPLTLCVRPFRLGMGPRQGQDDAGSRRRQRRQLRSGPLFSPVVSEVSNRESSTSGPCLPLFVQAISFTAENGSTASRTPTACP